MPLTHLDCGANENFTEELVRKNLYLKYLYMRRHY